MAKKKSVSGASETDRVANGAPDEQEGKPIPPAVEHEVNFQRGDCVLVLHDNELRYVGSSGYVISAGGIVQIKLSYQGKTVSRSYVPSQLMRIES